MRVASAVTCVVAVVSVACAAGCGSSSSSAFCAAVTGSKIDFSQTSRPAATLTAVDRLVDQLAPHDRPLVTPVRDYARILYGRSNWSEQRKLAFLNRFFHVDAPKLDRRLRDDCNVSLDEHISVLFVAPNRGST